MYLTWQFSTIHLQYVRRFISFFRWQTGSSAYRGPALPPRRSLCCAANQWVVFPRCLQILICCFSQTVELTAPIILCSGHCLAGLRIGVSVETMAYEERQHHLLWQSCVPENHGGRGAHRQEQLRRLSLSSGSLALIKLCQLLYVDNNKYIYRWFCLGFFRGRCWAWRTWTVLDPRM